MLPTPSTSHVDTDRVYEPAEDSFLFLDTISSAAEVSFLRQRFSHDLQETQNEWKKPSPLIMEVGIGSGVILAFLVAHAQTLFGRSDILSVGVDVNPHACKASMQTIEKASPNALVSLHNRSVSSSTDLFLTTINADLTSVIRSGTVDVLICNPPYVPTYEVPQLHPSVATGNLDNVDDLANTLSLSYAGGKDGMEVTNRLLQQLPYALNPNGGVAYVLLCNQNRPEYVMQRIREWGADWTVDVVGRSGKQGGWEKLLILRICRSR
ncbi:MAG: hypothetical protein Q9219_000910 [cf. Caloplaca sp. 3 TL-2023]